jgi:hypothetical protein
VYFNDRYMIRFLSSSYIQFANPSIQYAFTLVTFIKKIPYHNLHQYKNNFNVESKNVIIKLIQMDLI